MAVGHSTCAPRSRVLVHKKEPPVGGSSVEALACSLLRDIICSFFSCFDFPVVDFFPSCQHFLNFFQVFVGAFESHEAVAVAVVPLDKGIEFGFGKLHFQDFLLPDHRLFLLS